MRFGYHLATIESMSESDALAMAAHPLDSGDWWIGINDRDDNGTYDWVSGSAASYRDWRTAPERGNCGVLDAMARDWQDKGCGGAKPFICEAP